MSSLTTVNTKVVGKSITPTFPEQSKWTINNYFVYLSNNIVLVDLDMVCVSPDNSHPGAICVTGLPRPISDVYNVCSIRDGSSGVPCRVSIQGFNQYTEGALCIRYGTANKTYDGFLIYITDQTA